MSRTEPMTEFDERMVSAAEADLQQLLAIDPSPEFGARVRSRVVQGRDSRAPRWGWIGLAVASAAALVLALALRTDQTVPGQPTEIARAADITLPAAPVVPDVANTTATTPGVANTTANEHHGTRSVRPASTELTEAAPEIIVDPAMTDAIRRMAISLRNTSPDVSAAERLQIEVGEPSALSVAEPLNLPELVLKPADQSGGS